MTDVTPGPWVYVSDFEEVQGNGGQTLVAYPATRLSSRFDGTSLDVPEKAEMEANARLIAAAPTMRALLEQLLDVALPSSVLRVPAYIVETIKDVLREAAA